MMFCGSAEALGHSRNLSRSLRPGTRLMIALSPKTGWKLVLYAGVEGRN